MVDDYNKQEKKYDRGGMVHLASPHSPSWNLMHIIYKDGKVACRRGVWLRRDDG